MKNIPEQVHTALKMLSDAGFEAHIVGGCVRDYLLGRTPDDYDITTNALPEQTREVFRDFRCIDVGIKHGTIAAIINGMQLEITTYRIDGSYKDKRHPESVSFSTNLEDDLSRRDFTINAMACDSSRQITDCFEGKKDLENKTIRCVGDASVRFDEDALRIMRAIRFASQLGFTIEPETEKNIFSLKSTLSMISAERLRTELDKLLCGKAVYDILTKYHQVLSVFIPEITETVGFDQHSTYHSYTVWDHMARSVMNAPCDRTIRLTMLLHDISKPECFFLDKKGKGHFKGHPEKGAKKAEIILRRLKYDTKTIKTVTTLIKYHDHEFRSRQDIKKVMSMIGAELFFTLIDVQYADGVSKKEQYTSPINDLTWVKEQAEDILRKHECLSIRELDINGNQLEAEGYSGAQIGILLKSMLDAVLEDKLNNSCSELLEYAKRITK
ncbi:MAG: CCA tRNA nucleotidyltransferase [Ruminococcus sp.]|nr:CCA tRNA nucleotidyltransferase [Ruminococcus sp.]